MLISSNKTERLGEVIQLKKCILVASCPEGIGIVRAVADFFYNLDSSIVDAAQFTDMENQRFFTRWEVSAESGKDLPELEELKRQFLPLADSFDMTWDICDAEVKPRILLVVSKIGHCLNDFLGRRDESSFPGEIVGVVSNHDKFREKVEFHGLPFFHLPITPETKPQQEQQILDVMTEMKVDLLVLARYMQILSDEMCQKLSGKAINIHHSFLPSFKGAKPYHQAYERGVKIAGATAHYVTSDLDEGPIIEQDIQRIEHYYDASQMVELGKHVESVVLAKAVYWHCQHRILRDGNRTIIFK